VSVKPLDPERSDDGFMLAQDEEGPMRCTIMTLKRHEVGQLLGWFEDKPILVIDPADESDHRWALSGTR